LYDKALLAYVKIFVSLLLFIVKLLYRGVVRGLLRAASVILFIVRLESQ